LIVAVQKKREKQPNSFKGGINTRGERERERERQSERVRG